MTNINEELANRRNEDTQSNNTRPTRNNNQEDQRSKYKQPHKHNPSSMHRLSKIIKKKKQEYFKFYNSFILVQCM